MKCIEYKQLASPNLKSILETLETKQNETVHLYLDSLLILTTSTYYFLGGKVEKSIKILDKGIADYHETDIFLIEKSKILFLLSQYQEASNILDSLKKPNSPQALFERIKIALVTEKRTIAKRYCHEILEQDEHWQELGIQLTFFLATHHMINEALDCWKWVCSERATGYKFHLTRVALEYEQENYETAFKICSKLFKKFPNDMIICLYLSSLSLALNKYKKTIQISNHIITIHPECILAHKLLKEAYNKEPL